LWNSGDKRAFVKDAFHEYVVGGRTDAINPAGIGTKAALHYVLRIPAGAAHTVSLRLFAEKETPADPLGSFFEKTFATRIAEAVQELKGIADGESDLRNFAAYQVGSVFGNAPWLPR
jgi:hypothetical protein